MTTKAQLQSWRNALAYFSRGALASKHHAAIAEIDAELAKPESEPVAGMPDCADTGVCVNSGRYCPKEPQATQPASKPAKKHEPRIDLGRYAGTYGGYIQPQAAQPASFAIDPESKQPTLSMSMFASKSDYKEAQDIELRVQEVMVLASEYAASFGNLKACPHDRAVFLAKKHVAALDALEAAVRKLTGEKT